MQKLLALLLVLILTVPILPVGAQGQTYYVDSSGSDDTGDGSLDNPWRTIPYAATQVMAGDTVLINPGTYDGNIVVEATGTASEPITFRANGTGVIIEGSGAGRDAFFIDQADYIVVEGLIIQHADRAGLRISLSDHVTVRNCIFADNGRWGVFTDFGDYTLIENCESYGAVEEHGIYISNSSDYPTIRGNRLYHNHICGLHMNGDLPGQATLTVTDTHAGTLLHGAWYTVPITAATRTEPQPDPTGRQLYVVPGSGGGDGSAGNPFQGLQTAADNAQPGDVFHVAAGTYSRLPALRTATTCMATMPPTAWTTASKSTTIRPTPACGATG
jgi:hypothetical protein